MMTIENEHGISVNMMCASCQYKETGRLRATRYCTLLEKKVKPHGYCMHWKMSEGLKNAGKVED